MKSISGRDFCKVLERNGWVLRRISGSHHIYGKAGEATLLTVPVHGNKDLKQGLVADQLKTAGLTEADL